MSLPRPALERSKVEVDDAVFEIRSLTRAEAAACQRLVEREAAWDELEIAVIAAGTETPADEVRAWYADVPSHVAEAVFNAIRVLSRIDEGAQKSG